MGWLFGWDTRKELVDHLCYGNGVETLKRKFVGNNMWAVQRTKDGITFACLYLIKGRNESRDGWGYKDVDETMGPYDHNFPVSWLDLLSPIDSEYAVAWRAAVRKRGECLKRVVVGSVWDNGEHRYTVVKRRSPSSLIVQDELGNHWRISPGRLSNFDEVKS